MLFRVYASYQTRSGGMSWVDRVIAAPSANDALSKMKRHIGKRAVGELDMRAVELSRVPNV